MLKQVFVLLAFGFLAVQAIKWNNCDGSAPVQIKRVHLSPDPVRLRKGAKLNFGGQFVVRGDAGTRYKIHLNLQKKAWLWIKIPCIGKVGSCTYKGVQCEQMKQWVNQNKCPLPRQTHTLKEQSITIPDVRLPSFLANGRYWARVDMRDEGNNRRIACVEIDAEVRT